MDTVMDLIEEAPTVDVKPVKHGKWSDKMVAVEESGAGYHADDFRFGYQCSVCGGVLSKTNYCGNCGAKMDGKDE